MDRDKIQQKDQGAKQNVKLLNITASVHANYL
jgi:hypothetical protein